MHAEESDLIGITCRFSGPARRPLLKRTHHSGSTIRHAYGIRPSRKELEKIIVY
jgi:hypothetical protein